MLFLAQDKDDDNLICVSKVFHKEAPKIKVNLGSITLGFHTVKSALDFIRCFSRELIALNKLHSQGCSCMALISQLS